jgi:hypothetical protein
MNKSLRIATMLALVLGLATATTAEALTRQTATPFGARSSSSVLVSSDAAQLKDLVGKTCFGPLLQTSNTGIGWESWFAFVLDGNNGLKVTVDTKEYHGKRALEAKPPNGTNSFTYTVKSDGAFVSNRGAEFHVTADSKASTLTVRYKNNFGIFVGTDFPCR